MFERLQTMAPIATLTAALTATVLAGLAGCASGPDYQPPQPPMEAAFAQAAAGKTEESVAAFWRGFNDPQLDALIDQALAANTDVKIAQARLQEARANAGETQADRLPSFNTGAGVARVDPLGPGGSANQFNLSGSVNWELDFFGRNRRAGESAAARVQAGEAGVQAAQRLVSAEVASNYLALRTLQQRLRVAQESLVNQRESLRLVEARAQVGRGTTLDVARARALVDSTEATVPALQASIERLPYRLATLTGQNARSLNTQLATERLLPTFSSTDLSTLATGTPQALLERRPDIRVAERQLAAATAEIGVTRADLFPRISLIGLLGFTSNRLSNLLQADSRSSSLGASLSWTPFDFGRVRSRIGASEARALQALLVYEQTVQLALEETESALAQYTRNAQQTDKLTSAARYAEEAARLSRVRFEAGAADYLTVLDAERTVLQARDALVQAQGGTVGSLVSVYRALGGGWTAAP
jgi:outer membrane protein, multidrug efflux system